MHIQIVPPLNVPITKGLTALNVPLSKRPITKRPTSINLGLHNFPRLVSPNTLASLKYICEWHAYDGETSKFNF
jgi:hypothetical protein